MKIVVSTFIVFFFSFSLFSQNNWEWISLNSLPKPLTGNAICEVSLGENKYVYSFGGIFQENKTLQGNDTVYKYYIHEDYWEKTVSLPDSIARFGLKAHSINHKIYLLGGTSSSEDSLHFISDKVFIYNPFIDLFEADGASIPIPVKQPVQGVWRDSLIYIFAGKGQNGNIPDVQIYNPTFNSWSVGTALPETELFLCSGASGYILQDTIYYFGGVKEKDGNPVSYLRKGVINPENPEEINWSVAVSSPNQSHFKGACSGNNNVVFWIGGSENAYDYDFSDTLLPYAEGNQKLIEMNINKNLTYNYFSTPYHLSDVESIAKLGGGNWIVAGGTDSLGQISNRVFLLHNPELSDFEKAKKPPYFQVYETDETFIIETENIGNVFIYDLMGRRIYHSQKQLSHLVILKSKLEKGILLFVYEDGINLPVVLKRLNVY